MKKLSIRLLSALLLFTFCASGLVCSAQGIEFIHDKKFQELLNMAKTQNKVIFMDCYTSWCGPCKRLAATVFTDSTVGEYFNQNFICTKFDMEKDEGLTIANKYQVRAYPTLLWIDETGEVKHKVVGGMSAEELIDNGKKAIDPTPGILLRMRKQFGDGDRSPDFLCEYVNTLYDASEKYDDIFSIYLDKLTASEFNDPKHAKTIFNLTNDLKSPGMPYIIKNKDFYRHLIGDGAFDSKMNRIAAKSVDMAWHASDPATFNAALNLLKTTKTADQKEQMLKLSMEYYSHMADWPNYDKNATQYIKKYAAKDAKVLNDVAWDYYLNVNDPGLLQKATKWAYQSINMEDKYGYDLTYAYLLYKLNNYKEAEKAVDYAIIQAKKENVNPSSANALREYIKKSEEKGQ